MDHFDIESDGDEWLEEASTPVSGDGCSMNNESGDAYGQSGEEDEDHYEYGGYHRVSVGEVYVDRYRIEAKLGWGHFSTVWLATDMSSDPLHYVAIKFQKSAKHYAEAAMDEILLHEKVLKEHSNDMWLERCQTYSRMGVPVSSCRFVTDIYDKFVHTGENGTHICMVMELMGPNVLSLISAYGYSGIPLDIVRRISMNVLMGLDYLHNFCNIIHTDLKPENVLVSMCELPPPNPVGEGETRDEAARVPSRLCDVEEAWRILGGDPDFISDRFHETQPRVYESPKIPVPKVKSASQQYKDKVSGESTHLVPPRNNSTPADCKMVLNECEQHISSDEEMCYTADHIYKIWEENNCEDPADEKVKRVSLSTCAGLYDIRPVHRLYFHQKVTYKICDLGNACWTHHHFASEIQTRQYRAPEVILECDYDERADMWSFACLVFELVTGEYLFAPKQDKSLSKEDSHLALMSQLLGPFPKHMLAKGDGRDKYFVPGTDELIHSRNIEHYTLYDLLIEKYKLSPLEANSLSSFLMPMLSLDPARRCTAQTMLRHPWLREVSGDTPYGLEPPLLRPVRHSSLSGHYELGEASNVNQFNCNSKVACALSYGSQ